MSEKLRVPITSGSALCRHLVREGHTVVDADKLTCAGDLASLPEIEAEPGYSFVRGDICDEWLLRETMAAHAVEAVMHFAAEGHADRSIDGHGAFVETNVIGTFQPLGAALAHYESLDGAMWERFPFHHISSDEVFGDLPFDSGIFTEERPYAPYSASKAASDHFVRDWHETYGPPVVLTNCSNNYRPYHFPLVHLVILNAFNENPLRVYGRG